MKALSIQQPFAYCITHGTKRVENRTWYTRVRGPVLIHASKAYQTDTEYVINAYSPDLDIIEMKRAPRGAIVGAAMLVACVRAHEVAEDQRIWAGGPWCFVFADVMAYSPIPYRGELGFFEFPDEIVAGVTRTNLHG